MDLKQAKKGYLGIRDLMKKGTPLSEFRLGQRAFRLADEDPDEDGQNLPVHRDDVWQDMLRLVLGEVPEGAEHAPPCSCELLSVAEKYDFAGLAGLPPAVRLMDGFFPVRDQSKRGACFAFALVALCEYMLGKTVELSEQSLFHFTKLVTPGNVEDLGDGAIILDSIHAVEEYGICPLSEWHYNPESWNYVEDPYNEGQGKALQRKLEAAQPYRFRNWRTLSHGSVLQFKQALSAGFPIYTGVLVTTDWDDAEVRRTGVIPMPRLFWRIRVLPPPRGLVEAIMEDNGIDPEDDEADVLSMQIAVKLIQETIEYVGSAVFKCGFYILEKREGEDGIELVVLLDKIAGGHALCLAGYADNPSYPGGGYFIARNSWSEDKWAPDSPEMPGYALLPYAYIADSELSQEGIVMSDFPNGNVVPGGVRPPPPSGGRPLEMTGTAWPSKIGSGSNRLSVPGAFSQQMAAGGRSSGAASRPSAFRAEPPVPAPASEGRGFEAWLAAHTAVLDRPLRDQSGILLRPGTSVLVPDLDDPGQVLRDIPENRAKLRKGFEEEKAREDYENKAHEEQEAKDREARLESAILETIRAFFEADEYAVVSIPELKTAMLAREPLLAEVAGLDARIRAVLIENQKKDKRKFWFGRGFGGTEEIRPSGKDSARIFV